jgi:hypothetical protein
MGADVVVSFYSPIHGSEFSIFLDSNDVEVN